MEGGVNIINSYYTVECALLEKVKFVKNKTVIMALYVKFCNAIMDNYKNINMSFLRTIFEEVIIHIVYLPFPEIFDYKDFMKLFLDYVHSEEYVDIVPKHCLGILSYDKLDDYCTDTDIQYAIAIDNSLKGKNIDVSKRVSLFLECKNYLFNVLSKIIYLFDFEETKGYRECIHHKLLKVFENALYNSFNDSNKDKINEIILSTLSINMKKTLLYDNYLCLSFGSFSNYECSFRYDLKDKFILSAFGDRKFFESLDPIVNALFILDTIYFISDYRGVDDFNREEKKQRKKEICDILDIEESQYKYLRLSLSFWRGFRKLEDNFVSDTVGKGRN